VETLERTGVPLIDDERGFVTRDELW